MKKHRTIQDGVYGDHIFFIYSSPEERLKVLGEYIKQGLIKNELCILVTSEVPKVIIKKIKSTGIDLDSAYFKKSLKIYDMQETYFNSGKFIADYMLNNINEFLKDAKNHGFNGLRTAGEMGWLIQHPKSAIETVSYEKKVNNIVTDNNSPLVGLCLYPATTKTSSKYYKTLQKLAKTHKSFVYNR
jgi:hypothetical protein